MLSSSPVPDVTIPAIPGCRICKRNLRLEKKIIDQKLEKKEKKRKASSQDERLNIAVPSIKNE